MTLSDIIAELSSNIAKYDITLYPPATTQELMEFERKLKCPLPDDVKDLYLFCNGFESAEDLFRIIPLDEICDRLDEFPPNSFFIAEYLTYCDAWEIEIQPSNPNEYIIVNKGVNYRVLTKSLAEFLTRFLAKGVFEQGGLYTWHEEIDRRNGIAG